MEAGPSRFVATLMGVRSPPQVQLNVIYAAGQTDAQTDRQKPERKL